MLDDLWLGTASNNYDDSSNWSQHVVPSASDSAYFDTGQENIVVWGTNSVGAWALFKFSNTYSFTIEGGSTLDFYGTGIHTLGLSLIINISGILGFHKHSSAGGATITLNDDGQYIYFTDHSSAGHAAITINQNKLFFTTTARLITPQSSNRQLGRSHCVFRLLQWRQGSAPQCTRRHGRFFPFGRSETRP
jgi:hypothetical protein